MTKVTLGTIGCASALALIALAALARQPAAGATTSAQQGARWWKGNTHTHTLWSDGDEFPEIVVEWYKTNGYHFLGLSDHNTMQQGIEWLSVRGLKRQGTLDAYLKRFGPKGVSLRHENGVQQFQDLVRRAVASERGAS